MATVGFCCCCCFIQLVRDQLVIGLILALPHLGAFDALNKSLSEATLKVSTGSLATELLLLKKNTVRVL